MTRAKAALRRCAIYTRKSSEEGLEQDFNSLHAQREACEAYIRSQAGEGWQSVKTTYDDGGLSGGTIKRPALQRLMADIAEGRIDTVVVYKVDRLTRALMDFARIVEIFDRHGVTFVAVTQQFNTTTSMGRLTLNVLLSFAQFEREVTGERIRDKIAASKKKGMWMGGVTPLGYEVKDRKLVINQAEANTVRHIFERYLELGCVRLLKAELDRRAIHSKLRVHQDGTQSGACAFSRGALYTLLANPIYNGEIRHKEKRHPGLHEPILERQTFEAVQRTLAEGGSGRRGRTGKVDSSPLLGKLFDEAGNRLTPSHAVKQGRRYRYYVSRAPVTDEGQEKGWRLPAPELERIVAGEAAALLEDKAALSGALEQAGLPPKQLPAALGTTSRMREQLLSETGRAAILATVVDRAEFSTGKLALTLQLLPIAGIEGTITRSVPLRIKRRGIETRLVIESDSPKPVKADPILLKEIARAHRCFEAMLSEGLSVTELAAREGLHRSYISCVLPLAFLSPWIVEAILQGSQPVDLMATTLVKQIELPIDWRIQERDLGFQPV